MLDSSEMKLVMSAVLDALASRSDFWPRHPINSWLRLVPLRDAILTMLALIETYQVLEFDMDVDHDQFSCEILHPEATRNCKKG